MLGMQASARSLLALLDCPRMTTRKG